MEEAMEMDGLTLIRKIKGRNPTLGKMKEWARKNWTGIEGEGPILIRLQMDGLASCSYVERMQNSYAAESGQMGKPRFS